MAITIHQAVHRIINRNGVSLWLPANIVGGRINFAEPDVYAQSATQLYPLGSKAEFADGRVFRYSKIGATSTSVPMARLCVNANLTPGAPGDPDVDGFEGDPYVAAAIGATHVDLEIATAYAENFFEDGMLACYPANHYCEYRICGNDLGTGTYCRVYLDSPLKTALGVATGITAYKSIFSQVKDAAAEGVGYSACVGAYLGATFTVDYFCWIQRRGRCIVTPTAYFGDNSDERVAQLHTDGTIALKNAHGTQYIGYLTQRTELAYGDLEVWLQLE